jgi:Trypsin-like peptidase domain
MEVRGTGFLVAPDLVATALHVVASRETEPPTFFAGKITLHFQGRIGTDFTSRDVTAEAIRERCNQDADCVLLKCEPLDGDPIIPLREVSESGGLWKTRGYPDAQPVDGMTWDGDVTAYRERLTSSYETRDVPYEPVLQLFCKQAAGGTGAPPRGLSGAPVVIGTAAVGLLRYALMEDNRTVGGTLYACSAKDIMELWPERLNLCPALLVGDGLARCIHRLLPPNYPGTRCRPPRQRRRSWSRAEKERIVAAAMEPGAVAARGRG